MADLYSKHSTVDMIASQFRKFAALIGLDEKSTEFQNMKNNFNDLRKQFLSIDYSSMKQIFFFRLIENELERRYPHLFEGKNGQKHLYFALHVFINDHGRLRDERKAASVPKNNQDTAASKNIQRNQPIETDEIIDLTDEQNINSIIRNIKPIVPPPPNSIVVSRPALRAIQNLANVDKAPTSSPAPRRHSPPQYTGGTSSMHGPASGSSQPNRAIAIRNPPKEDDVPSALRQTEIYKFLSTCQPPMTHHLQRFVNVGCVMAAYLYSVSRGRAEQRYKLLKWILGSDARDAGFSLLEMDIALLEWHFDNYFAED